MIDFTVVICTHNRAELLRLTLAHLVAADSPPGGWDLLVIANACTDETETVLQDRVQRLPNLRWAKEPIPGKSNALNRAIGMLRSPAAVFIDDDHRVSTDFLVEVRRALQEWPEAEMLCGRIQPDWDGTEPEWVHEKGPYPILPRPIPAFYAGTKPRALSQSETLPGGGNLIVRRQVFPRVGTFNPGLGPSGHDLGGAEDADFLHRALAAGERLFYVPAILQYHAVNKDHLQLKYLVRKSFQRSRASQRFRMRSDSGIPLYLWKKCLIYGLKAVSSLPLADRRRFYFVRLAAALGEMQGPREAPVRDPRK